VQDNSWMKSLKPGDVVALSGGLGGRELLTGKIDHITKTGRFVIKIGKHLANFNPDGSERTSGDGYYNMRIREYTQEIAIQIHTKHVTDELYHTVWNSIPLGKLDRIISILREVGE
jgi:hypothetical protein